MTDNVLQLGHDCNLYRGILYAIVNMLLSTHGKSCIAVIGIVQITATRDFPCVDHIISTKHVMLDSKL